MLQTFMRTTIGLDETVFLKYFLSDGVDFQNIDDMHFANFQAGSLLTRVGRRLLRTQLSADMVATVRRQIDRGHARRAFIFNGRGFNNEIATALEGLEHITWFNPDFLRHAEHAHVERVATRIISTKPADYNAKRYANCRPRDGIVHINPVIFSTDHEADLFLQSLRPNPIDQRPIDVGFLGNCSPSKRETIEELARLIKRRITVVGAGWRSNERVEALGPIYGPPLKAIFENTKVGLAFPDIGDGVVDPITVRYFQYPILGTLPILQRNGLNRSILDPGLDAFCYENLVEAADRVEATLAMSRETYDASFRELAAFSVKSTLSAERVCRELVL
ncbi:hypothetical protein ACGYLM_18480 [Sulfitobacter sp. 1A10445]|uniref:glycosyltransferase family protein n=1 Tax=unclassified Sulfitobacter TaxID=196795 RepID=UPI003744C582